MKNTPQNPAPAYAAEFKTMKPVVCYPVETLPRPNVPAYQALRDDLEHVERITVPPREGVGFKVPQGYFFRISVAGPQVGDLNLFNANNLDEKFYSGKTRAINGTHVGTGDQLFSSFPYLRPIATITYDTLDWYGYDKFGGGIHDVIGTRCDPYTHNLLSGGGQYHNCCHSNLTRGLANSTGLALIEAEKYVHDVLNVFMCTGFMPETGQYFMKKTPVQPGDYLEMFAEIDLLGVLSACPGGDCSETHSSDVAVCSAMYVDIYRPKAAPEGWVAPALNGYDRSHGVKA